MSNIFEQLDVKSEQPVHSEPIEVKLDDKPVEEPVSKVTVLPDAIEVVAPIKKKKCNGYREDGSKCRRNAKPGTIYCSDHNNEQPEEQPADEMQGLIISPDVATKSLLSLHLTIYMLTETLSSYTNYPIEGMAGRLGEDIDAVKEVYDQIVEYYGVERISSVVSPTLSLALITSKHYLQAIADAKKKSDT
jgi:hypothetical protein